MKLLTKKTEANLAHIKWASTHIRMMNALANYKINRDADLKSNLNESISQKKSSESNKPLKVEAEKRITLEELTSNSLGQNSDFENIVFLAKAAIIRMLFFVTFVPIMKLKYFLWDLPFKK